METNKIANELLKLGGFMSERAKFSQKHSEFTFFPALIYCSLNKSYEFLKLVYLDENNESCFFITSFLRGLCEDIIILESIHNFPFEKREKLLRGIQLLELNERVHTQWDFFELYRPFQPVINTVFSFDKEKNEVQNIWRENGWPKFEVTSTRLMPPTKQLAEKLAPGILDVLYEFIYRLSSTTVHFSPQTLLRMSWGNIDVNNMSGTISVKHMANYHKTFCQVYGALLFTFYFEFFSDEIQATEKEQSIIEEIRKELLRELRWPEMVTFEEMNVPVPSAYHNQILTYGILHQAIIQTMQKGFANSTWKNFIEKIRIK